MYYKVHDDEVVIFDTIEEFIEKSPIVEIFTNNDDTYGLVSAYEFQTILLEYFDLDISNEYNNLDFNFFCFDEEPFKLYICELTENKLIDWIINSCNTLNLIRI
jgi:glycosyltransferase involved in cell wall biosynthesis